MNASYFVFLQSLKTPLDCACGGNGILFLEGGEIPCSSHFHMAKSEDYRLEILRLCYQNFRDFTISVEEKYKTGLPANRKEFDSWVKANSKPVTAEEWVLGAKSLIEQEVGYVLFHQKKGIMG